MPSRVTSINDALKFYQSVGSIEGANSRLSTLLNAALRRVLGEATLTHVVRDERAALMARVREQLDREAAAFGITVVDVRIRRADLPEQNSQAVYQRMQTERQREAAEFRANGSQRKQEIQARADRDVTVLIADAQSKAEQIRGEGDAERNRIFAEAFGKDPDFFAFYRSMQAYETGLRAQRHPHGAASPTSDFFRYFADPSGKPREDGKRYPLSCSHRQDACAAAHPRRRAGYPHGGFHRRARPRVRDRGADLCGQPGGGEERHGARAGDAGRAAAHRRHRLGGARRVLVWLVRG